MPEKHVSCHTADIDNEKDPLHTERVFSRYALITWRNAVSLGQSLVHDLGGLGEHLVQSLRGFVALGVHLVDVLQGYTCHNEFLLTKIRNPVGQHHTCEWFLLLGHCRYYTCFSPNRK